MRRPRIALVSREVRPFDGGGIGTYVAATAALLAEDAEVTIFTTDRHRARHRELQEEGRLGLAGVRFAFVAEPRGFELGAYRSRMHLWSARVRDALRAEYGERGPELVEFQDFLGAGFVTAQARRSGAAWLEATRVCVRINTTSELCDVLNGRLRSDLDARITFELERGALRLCDRLLWPGGDVLETYRRFYGEDELGEPELLRQPVARAPASGEASSATGPLRLLYLGRLERRKGVLELIEALGGLERDDWRLTLAGGDTETGPLGTSIRELATMAVGGDRRFELLAAVPHERVAGLIDASDLVVLPSRWECWPNVALEALSRDRPLLASATGGLAEMAVEGRSGWLAGDGSPTALAAAMRPLLAAPAEVRALAGSGGPRAVFESLTDPDEIRTGYLALCEESAGRASGDSRSRRPSAPGDDLDRRRSGGAGPPLVSVVIPFYGLPEYVGEALDSARAQTHPRIEVLLVNDGSFADRPLLASLAERHGARLLEQPNRGLGAARNLGISQANGEYVMPLDADDVAEPELVSRCLEALGQCPEASYVTCWSQFIDERGRRFNGIVDGDRPLGSRSRLLSERNVCGGAVALFRRQVFERGFAYDPLLTSFEDWDLYRRLAEAGLHGEAIPEPLLRYRIRAGSMARSIGLPHEHRLREELAASSVAARTRWPAGAETPGLESNAAQAAASARARLARNPGSRAGAAAAAALRTADGERAVSHRLATRGRSIARRARLVLRRAALRLLR